MFVLRSNVHCLVRGGPMSLRLQPEAWNIDMKRLPSSYVSIDLETTGLNCRRDRIVEISGVLVLDDVVVDKFETLTNPNRRMSSAARAVNGISESLLLSAPSLDAVLPEFESFVGGLVLLGHNVKRFDSLFLDRAYAGESRLMPAYQWFDTMELASRMFAGSLRLSRLCSELGVINNTPHRALSDCIATHECYQVMKQMLLDANL